MLGCFITDDGNLDHLLKVTYTGFSVIKLVFSSLGRNKL